MSNTTNYSQNKQIDAFFRGQSLGAPSTLYFTLLTCSKGARANSTLYSTSGPDGIYLTANDSLVHYYVCTGNGTSASAQGTLYPGVPGEVITDGSAQFTEQTVNLQAGTAQIEPSGGSYARVAVVASEANFAGTQGATTTTASSGTSAETSNNAAITWPSPTGNWQPTGGAIWGMAIYDAASSGNCWWWEPLTIPKTVNSGDAAPSFAISAWTYTCDIT
jgi:hypothetical protein